MKNMDLQQISFSYRGSYLAISRFPENFRGRTNPAGIFLRTVHGDAGQLPVCRLVPMQGGQELSYREESQPSCLYLQTEAGDIRICFADEETLLFEGKGEGLSLLLDELSDGSGYNYVHEVPQNGKIMYLINCSKNNNRYLLDCCVGTITADQDWTAEHTSYCRVRISPQNGTFQIRLREVCTDWDGKLADFDFEASRMKASEDFECFYQSMPEVPAEYEELRHQAAYVNWSSVVHQNQFLTRDALFMSKNWMTNVWSWDHCFNAMALAHHNPQMAWDQLMILFDHQDATGVIPDSINDSHIIWNFCKPPIHGWALSKMMQVMELTTLQREEAYDKLSRWTNWWLNCRDHDEDGICEYYHGNDSGWDNSTAFYKLPPVELPDLSAFLVLQMEVLGDLADSLSRKADALAWYTASKKTLTAMLEHSFVNGRPRALLSRTHEEIDTDSLILYLPIVLGKRLPLPVREMMLKELRSERFYTDFGFATESVQSNRYESDGYWRGPIWAPSSMIIIDGLYACGETEFAAEATRKFCEMTRKSGFAENFDALTGEGLRDRAYTWTSSAFLMMAHDYL